MADQKPPVPEDVKKYLRDQKWLLRWYDTMTWLIAVGTALFSGGAAIQAKLTSNTTLTAILGGIGAACAVVQAAIKFPSRASRASNCVIDLESAIRRYELDPTLDGKWLGEQVAKALERLREGA
jgi:hypothetical protein